MHDLKRPAQLPAIDSAQFAVRGLSHRYPDGTLALDSVDLTLAAGDRLALVGHNGSGKTTLVKQLCGLLQPTSGEVHYQGQLLRGAYLQRARLEIGLLFQDPDDQLFGHTVLEDVAFGPRNQGLSQPLAEQAAKRALQQVGLLELAYKAPHNLSFGQKKRAALAGLLAMNPSVLILDEPTANLDPRQQELFLQLLRQFPGTLICISHDLILLYELCNRALVLEGGRVHHDYSLQELVSQRQALREHGLDFSFRFVTAPAAAAVAESTPGPVAAEVSRPVPQSSPLIALSDYHFRYPDGTRALRGIDLRIAGGERLAIVGENGAGKSTLLSCLLGLRQGQGRFEFDGQGVGRRMRQALWRQVGLVFQNCADQLFCASVAEEVGFGLRQLGLPAAEVEGRVAAALAQVRLQGFEQRVPLHLSGGERKRLALACVLAMKPRLLILDEPTAGLDPQGEELLLGILRGLDVSLLLVSHDMFFVGELTRRTLVMHQGEIVRDLPTAEFLLDENLAALNGLSFTYRQRSSSAIRELQHAHEHSHRHRHLHEHLHRHGELVHSHPHEHEHEHSHRFVHSHSDPPRPQHDHQPPAQPQLHDHQHPDHADTPHDHEH
ncbi:MAG: ABC transporter ATP-binding protein [Trichloromonadaceae bacterium]